MNIVLNEKGNFIGYFDNEIIAAECYDTFILQNNVVHAPLNFPEKKELLKNKIYVPIQEKKKCNNEYYGVKKNDIYYQARIVINKKEISIKSGKTAEECALAYDQYLVANKIYERKLNFPENHPEYATKLNVKTFYEPYDEESVKLIMYNKDIVALVNKKDYEIIKYYKCSCSGGGYVTIKSDKKKPMLHRWLLKVTDPEITIDHINSNRSDNRRNNLRSSNEVKNAQNKSKQKSNCTSKYIGISYRKSERIWVVSIIKNLKQVLNKTYKTEEEAARCRDLYIILFLPNDHYKKNFKWTEDEIKVWKEKLNFD